MATSALFIVGLKLVKVQRGFKNMNIFGCGARLSRPRWGKQILISALSLALLFATCRENLPAYQDAQASEQPAQGPPYAQQTPEQLQQLVAPIALYPDSLVAQILAASTYPEQVVEADRWVQEHQGLQGDALGQAVDQQQWDPSVKALTAFPSVLGNMDKNLSWTSSLGDAYYNQEKDVMDAIQVMRQQAEQAGNLKTTPQQTVMTEGSTIVVQPVDPDVVYVPAYDPWVVYGGPIVAWPGWYPYPGIWYGGPYLSFGLSFRIGFFGGFGWGWPHWGFNWDNHYATFDRGRYYSHSTTFYNRSTFYGGGGARAGVPNRGAGAGGGVPNRGVGAGGAAPDRGVGAGGAAPDRGAGAGGGVPNRGVGAGGAAPDRGVGAGGGAPNRGVAAGGGVPNRGVAAGGGAPNRGVGAGGGVSNRPAPTPRPFQGNTQAARGYAAPQGQSGVRSGAFSHIEQGGQTKGYSARGSASLGGGAPRGGGGGAARGGGGGRH